MDKVGLPKELVAMASQASEDEFDHAGRCRAIIAECGEPLDALAARQRALLGPAGLSFTDRVLYTSAAMGCITETLSTALLLEMRKRLDSEIIDETVHAILGDEVNHSRLGWAHLALASQASDVGFLAEYLPNMLEPVLQGESEEASEKSPVQCDVYGFGILPKQTVDVVFEQTLFEVIIPGFEEFGVDTHAARQWGHKRFRS